MPTTPYLPQPPTVQGSNLSQSDYMYQLILQGLAPIFEVDTSKGGYTETAPPAGINPANPATGQSAQGKEIIYIKVSSDANVYTLKGVVGGPQTLSRPYQILRIKSDGTNWYPVGSTAPTALELEVNGTPNEDQALLNLVAGANVTITDEGAGEVKIAASGGSSLELEVNGTPNADQALLNLTAGANVTITDEGGGEIVIAASGGGSGSTEDMAVIPPFAAGAGVLAGYTLVLRIPAEMLVATGSGVKVGLAFYNLGTAAVHAASIGATLPNPIAGVSGFDYDYAWTTAPVAFTWPSGSFASDSEVYLSNEVPITVDTEHDYYVMIYLDSSTTADSPYLPTSSGPAALWSGLGGYFSGNHTNDADASTVIAVSSSGVPGLFVQQVTVVSSGGGGGGSSAWASLTGDLTETQVVPWDGPTVGTPDTGLSRVNPGVVAVGDGSAGDSSGSLQLTAIESAAGSTLEFDETTADGWYLQDDSGTNTFVGGVAAGIVMTGFDGATLQLDGANGEAYLADDTAAATLYLNSGEFNTITTGGVDIADTSGAGITIEEAGTGGITIHSLNEFGDVPRSISLFGHLIAGAYGSVTGKDFAGQVTITAGNTSQAVSFNSNFTGTGEPVVILTPTSNIAVDWWVTYSGSAGAWSGFTVHISSTLGANVTFNYVVIGQQ